MKNLIKAKWSTVGLVFLATWLLLILPNMS
ncbi:hypothetical protein SAMN05216271_0029 [Halopseudomonas sabulinigri]|uniref:Uncharacterized protein n=1 Tax=Halopseudomonas sabulinigri TaxID=472181 RepID=A0A1H1L2Y0_9GAMM|nr:hypothetical protein SAMN05216271_0029 [Halopseudomonas sabulinigri]